MTSPGARRSLPALLVAAGLIAALVLLSLALLRGQGNSDEALGPDFFRDSRRSPVEAEARPAAPPGSVSATFDEVAAELAAGARVEAVVGTTARLFAMALGERGPSVPTRAAPPWSARRAWLRGGLILYELENGAVERELTLFRPATARAPAASLTMQAHLRVGCVQRVSLRFDLPGQFAPIPGVGAWRSRGAAGGSEFQLVPEPTDSGERRRFSRRVVVLLPASEAVTVFETLAELLAERP